MFTDCCSSSFPFITNYFLRRFYAEKKINIQVIIIKMFNESKVITSEVITWWRSGWRSGWRCKANGKDFILVPMNSIKFYGFLMPKACSSSALLS